MDTKKIHQLISLFIDTINRHLDQLQKKTTAQSGQALDFNRMDIHEFMKYFEATCVAQCSSLIKYCSVDKNLEEDLKNSLKEFDKVGFNDTSIAQLHQLKRCLESALRYYTNLVEELRDKKEKWLAFLSFPSLKTPHPLPIESFDLRGYYFFKKYGALLDQVFEATPHEKTVVDLVEILKTSPHSFPEDLIENYFQENSEMLSQHAGKFPLRELEEALTRVQLMLPIEERGDFVKSCFEQCNTLLLNFPLVIPDMINLQDRDITIQSSARLQKVRDLHDFLQTNARLLDQGSPNKYPGAIPNLMTSHGMPVVLANNQEEFLALIDLYHKQLVGGLENSLRASRKIVKQIDQILSETNTLIDKSHQLV
jgi:hypothetical protein